MQSELIRQPNQSPQVSALIVTLLFPFVFCLFAFLAWCVGQTIVLLFFRLDPRVPFSSAITALTLAALVMSALTSKAMYETLRWKFIPNDGSTCTNCNYNLTGNITGRCPECGTDTCNPS